MAPSNWPLRVVGACILAIWAAYAVPLLLGWRTPYLRDTLSIHAPLKRFGTAALRAGSIPAFNPEWGLGQPFRGNPNALPFYPSNLLYLMLPFWSAFGAHFALHWLLAFLAMRALARELGQSREAALMAALTYAGSGYLLSCLTFYNLLVVAAWWPLVLWGAARGGRRGIAVGGLACGLAVLGGEPISTALGAVPLLLVAAGSRGWRRGGATAAAIAALGALIALPQLVATLRILPFSSRGGPGVLASEAVSFALHPLRFLELLLPLPFGSPGRYGVGGFWASSIAESLPFFFSLYAGAIGLWLAVRAAPARRRWAALALAGLLGAWIAGWSGDLLVRLTAGLFRYPEKLLFWPALAIALLAGWGLDGLRRTAAADATVAATPRRLLFTALSAATAGGLLLALRPWFFSRSVAAADPAFALRTAEIVAHQVLNWSLGLMTLGALLALAAFAQRSQHRASAPLLLAAQVCGLLQLLPLLATDRTAPYDLQSPWAVGLPAGAGVANSALVLPRWPPQPHYTVGDAPRWQLRRVLAGELDASSGARQGLRYPLAPDLEGTGSARHGLLMRTLPGLSWPARRNWFLVTGVETAVLYQEPATPGLRLRDTASTFKVQRGLYSVEPATPAIYRPTRLEVAANLEAQLRAVAAAPDAGTVAVVERALPAGTGTVALRREQPDRIEFDSAGEGGLVVLRRAFQPLFVAHAGGQRLETLPVNLVLQGVIVPPGPQRVVLEVSNAPELAAGVVALLAALLAAAAAVRERPLRPLGASSSTS